MISSAILRFMKAFAKRLGYILLFSFVLLALAKGLYMMFWLLASEMNAAHHGWDGAIYTTVGRGILNGLTPYTDLFETKPPGMFLISALSLWLVDSIHLANVLQGVAEITIIVALIVPTVVACKTFRTGKTVFFIASTLVFGCLLVAYTVQQAGHFQSESFGAAALALYAAYTMSTRNYKSIPYILVSALCFAFAIGVKEPFIFIALAVSLLATRKPKDLLFTYFLPLGIALIAGTIFMVAIGYLRPYLEVYLPEMLSGRAGYFNVPVWYYIFLVSKLLGSLWSFSKPLAVAIVLVWSACIAFAASAWKSPQKVVSLFLVVASFTVLIVTLGARVEYVSEHGGSVSSLLVLLGVSMCVYVATTYALLHRFLSSEEKNDILKASAVFLGSILLTTYVMGSGGFLRQHYGFPVALYAVLYMMFVTYSIQSWSIVFHRWVYYLVTLLTGVGMVMLPIAHIKTDLQQRIAGDAGQRKVAAQVDAIMDACTYERYVLVGSTTFPYQHTTHSPIGPGFHRMEFVSVVDWRPPPIPYLLETFKENLQTVELAIVAPDFPTNVPPDLVNYISLHFTTTPPACASALPFESSAKLYYRLDE